jgi:hypothetical protein
MNCYDFFTAVALPEIFAVGRNIYQIFGGDFASDFFEDHIRTSTDPL